MRKHFWIGSLIVTVLLASHSHAQDEALANDESTTSTLEQSASGKSARPGYRRFFLDIGFGRLSPGSDLKSDYKAVVGYEVVAGFRFNRYALAEFGADFGFGAGKTDRVISTTGGVRGINDYQAAGLFGGRLVLPMSNESFLLSAGGGYARLKYGESVKLLPNETINCISCTQRSGNGYYTVVQGLLLIDEAKRFGLGVTFRHFSGTTQGNFLQRGKTNDSWNAMTGAFSIRF